MDEELDKELEEGARSFLRGWIKDNLPVLSNLNTNVGELQAVRRIPGRLRIVEGDLKLQQGDRDLMDEIHFGSSRWPTLRVYDHIDDYLLQQVEDSIPDDL